MSYRHTVTDRLLLMNSNIAVMTIFGQTWENLKILFVVGPKMLNKLLGILRCVDERKPFEPFCDILSRMIN